MTKVLCINTSRRLLESRAELEKLKEKNFLDTASALNNETVAKIAKDDAEAKRPKIREVETINLDTVIRQVTSTCKESCFRLDSAGDFLAVELQTLVDAAATGAASSMVFFPPNWIRTRCCILPRVFLTHFHPV